MTTLVHWAAVCRGAQPRARPPADGHLRHLRRGRQGWRRRAHADRARVSSAAQGADRRMRDTAGAAVGVARAARSRSEVTGRDVNSSVACRYCQSRFLGSELWMFSWL